MSILSNNNMGTPYLSEIKRQASFFLREKLRSARLALTDVTPAELMTEEVTNGNPSAPDARAMSVISKAAFEVGDYFRIVEILHKRLGRAGQVILFPDSLYHTKKNERHGYVGFEKVGVVYVGTRLAKFDRKNWRQSYQAMVLLEHLLTHGPESVSREFKSDKQVIRECGNFQYIDERGFNWGLAVRKKSERILKFLDEGDLLKEERQRARKLTREIQGFGSFSHRSSNSAAQTFVESVSKPFGRCNSQYDGHAEQEDSVHTTDRSSTESGKSRSSSDFSADSESSVSSTNNHEVSSKLLHDQTDESNCPENNEENESLMVIKKDEVVCPKNPFLEEHDDDWDLRRESQPLLDVHKEEKFTCPDSPLQVGDNHPFTHPKVQSRDSLLSARTQ